MQNVFNTSCHFFWIVRIHVVPYKPFTDSDVTLDDHDRVIHEFVVILNTLEQYAFWLGICARQAAAASSASILLSDVAIQWKPSPTPREISCSLNGAISKPDRQVQSSADSTGHVVAIESCGHCEKSGRDASTGLELHSFFRFLTISWSSALRRVSSTCS